MHGSQQYIRATAKDRAAEREKHRKAARLALDTSSHAGSQYHNFMRDYKVTLLRSRRRTINKVVMRDSYHQVYLISSCRLRLPCFSCVIRIYLGVSKVLYVTHARLAWRAYLPVLRSAFVLCGLFGKPSSIKQSCV